MTRMTPPRVPVPHAPRRRAPALRGACGLLAGLALAASAAAAETAPVTSLEAGPYRRADAVLLGVVEAVHDVRAPGGALGRQIARVAVEKVYKGAVRAGSRVTVIVHGQRPTLDPSKPSVPYFRANATERFVLFLGTSSGGASYRMQTLFDTADKTGPEKIAAVEAVASMASVQGAHAKGRRALKLLLEMLRDPRGWTKTFAARELAWFAAAQPEAFDPKSQAALRRAAKSRMTTDQRFWLRRAFRSLQQAGKQAQPAPRDAAADDPWRSTWLAAATPEARRTLLTRLLRKGDGVARHGWWAYARSEPSLRRWFVRALGDSSQPLDTQALRDLYPTEDDPQAREAIIRTLGLRGSDDDVPWLEARSRNLVLRRPALLALARVRTPAARAALARRRRALAATGEADLAAWVDHLLSPAFEAAERRAGREPGGR